MQEPESQRFLEERLRRDAPAARSKPSPELQARIVAALDGELRSPERRRSRPWLVAAAALFLIAGVLWFARPQGGPPALPGAGPRANLTASAAPEADPSPRSVRGASASPMSIPVGEQVRSWARTSSMMLRAKVDDPLRKELAALSLDFVRVVDAVVIGLPEALARPFETLF